MQSAHRPAATRFYTSCVLMASLWWASAANAQQAIHKCVVDGHLIFTSVPCALEPPAAQASATASSASTLSSAAVRHKKTLAEVLRERDGEAPGTPVIRESQGDGANVLRSRMGAV